MVNGIVQRVRPKGRLILKDGHRGVVGEVLLKKHLKLFVSASLKEGRSHAANVGLVDAAVQVQNLALTCNFLFPLLLGETLAKAVTVFNDEIFS